MNKYIVIFFLSFYNLYKCQFCYGQKTDSLLTIFHNESIEIDKRLRALDDVIWSVVSNNPDSALALSKQELVLSIKAYNGKINKWTANAIKNYGVIYSNKGNYPKALNCFLKALTIFEEIGDKIGEGACYTNIGSIYHVQGNYSKALEYYLKDLEIVENSSDKNGLTESLNNIGLVYYYQLDFQKSLEYYFKSLDVCIATNNRLIASSCYGNIGNVYADQGNQKEALNYYLKDLAIRKELKDVQGVAICYANIGELLIDKHDYQLSIIYSDSCVQLSKEIKYLSLESVAHQNLATAYNKLNKFKNAIEHHVIYKQLTDSIFNEENSKQLGDLKTQFEVDKKALELKIIAEAEQDKVKVLARESKKKQNIVIVTITGILVSILMFLVFLYNRFKIAQKQKKIIEEQKVLVDNAYESLHEKNKEVMDSIYYARRIQRALITSESYIERVLNKLNKNS